MLSEAKHLLFLVENKQKQMLRFAQHDMAEGFFSNLLNVCSGLDKKMMLASLYRGISFSLYLGFCLVTFGFTLPA